MNYADHLINIELLYLNIAVSKLTKKVITMMKELT